MIGYLRSLLGETRSDPLTRTLAWVAVTLVAVVVAVAVTRCSESGDAVAWDRLRASVDAQVEERLAAGRVELERLQVEVDAVHGELEVLRFEIEESVTEREEEHDELDLANSIDAVDRVLRAGGMVRGRR